MLNAFRRRFRQSKENDNRAVSPECEGLLLEGFWDKDVPFTVMDEEAILFKSVHGNEVWLCSLHTGRRLHTYPGLMSMGQLPLGNDCFVSVNPWSIDAYRDSSGAEFGFFNWNLPKEDPFEFHGMFKCSALRGEGYFLIGTENGDVLQWQWSEISKLRIKRAVNTRFSDITAISMCDSLFAIFSYEKNTLAVFELVNFDCVAAIEEANATSIQVTDLLLVTGCRTGKIVLFNPFTLEPVCEFRTHTEAVESVEIMGDGRHLLSAGRDGLICIQDIETGVSVWQKLFNTAIYHTALLSDGRLVVGFQSEAIVVFKIPPELAKFMITPPTPLRDALESCISGAELPETKCNELISSERSSASFDEWCCAHQLLMMAVEDGTISRSQDYKGEIGWWFENLYIAAKDIEMASDDDVRSIKRFLLQAKKMGVVEGIEAVLTAILVTKDVKAEVRALQRADIMMLERVLSIETRLEMLKDSFHRYKQHMRVSQLIGVALQIIPIAGGSVAGVVSAGADIVEGLSAKDLTDYFLGLGSSLLSDELSGMNDRVFRCAAESLDAEKLEEMYAEHRQKLEEAVKSCSMSVRALRELFMKHKTLQA